MDAPPGLLRGCKGQDHRGAHVRPATPFPMTAWQTVRRDLMHGVIFTACASAVLYALRYHQAAVAVAHFSQSINACLLLVMLFETVRARNRRVARLRRFQAI